MRKKDKQALLWTVLIVLSFFIGYNFLSIGLTKDTAYLPTTIYLEVFEENQPFKNAQISGTFAYDTESFGGCADLPNCRYVSKEHSSEVCRSAGFDDRGCGWNEEVACDCNTCQTGCNGHTTIYPSNVNIKVSGVSVYSCSTCSGSFTTNNFADSVNNYCISQRECSVPIEMDGTGSITYLKINYELGELKVCPDCSSPSDWSVCINGKQTRNTYYCDETTDYKCVSKLEEQTCSICSYGEERTKACNDGSVIVIERCEQGKWIQTGLNCKAEPVINWWFIGIIVLIVGGITFYIVRKILK